MSVALVLWISTNKLMIYSFSIQNESSRQFIHVIDRQVSLLSHSLRYQSTSLGNILRKPVAQTFISLTLHLLIVSDQVSLLPAPWWKSSGCISHWLTSSVLSVQHGIQMFPLLRDSEPHVVSYRLGSEASIPQTQHTPALLGPTTVPIQSCI